MNTFESLGLGKELLEAITAMGYTTPTPVQEQSIPLLLENNVDIVSLAQTGTGKTAAFGLPLLQKTEQTTRAIKALVLSPTRELCLQITKEFEKFSAHMPGHKVVSVYGGANIREQIKALRKGANIIVATPGRLMDLMDRGEILLDQVEIVVLDEADEMLNMGFKEDIDTILQTTPPTRQTWLFSATMPKEVARIAKNYMTDPKEISVGRVNQTATNIEHMYHLIDGRERMKVLTRVLDFYPDTYAIVFCRTRMETAQVADKLMEHGYPAGALHGDLSQVQRDNVMNAFRKRAIQILVATDVAARGIDVDDITHVIHYHLPDDLEAFTHRSGRTARAGKSGISIALVARSETRRLRDLERMIKKTIDRRDIPSGDEVCSNQMLSLIEKIKKEEPNESNLAIYQPIIEELYNEYDPKELLNKIFSLEFNRLIEMYKNAPDLNQKSSGNQFESQEGGERRRMYYINLGAKDDFDWTSLKDFLRKATGLRKDDITGVQTFSTFSVFRTSDEYAQQIMESFNGTDFNGRQLFVKLDEKRKESSAPRNRGGSGKFNNTRDNDSRGGGGFRDSFNKKDRKRKKSGSRF